MVQRTARPEEHDPSSEKQNGGATTDREGRNSRPAVGKDRLTRLNGSTDGEEAQEVDEPELERAPSSSRSRGPSPEEQPTHQTSILLLGSTISLLIFATIWGVLARLGLEWIGGFAEGQVFSLIWAQIVGCLVMGLVVERKKGIEKLYPPLFVACGTGFCGSLTTFSSWMHDVFVSFANVDTNLGRFNGFMSGSAVTVVTLGLSTAALTVGGHLSSFLPHTSVRAVVNPPRHHHIAPIFLGPLCWLGAAFLLAFGPHSWRSRATFAIVLGPPGTLLRYYFSKRLNPLRPNLPLGTLAANTLACLCFAVFAILQRHSGVSSTGCAALQGALDGFCGSLSTVSTFVVELRSLKRGDSYRYFILSWLLGQVFMVVVLGSWLWSGDRGSICSF